MGKIKVIKKSTLSGRAEANDYKIYPVTKTDAVFTDSDDKDECDTQTPQGANKTAKEIFNSIRKKGWVNKERIKDGAVTWDKLAPEAQKVIEDGIDEVHKRSNYNDGDNIIDFNTVHLITDNPEYICVAVDADNKILYGIKTDGQPYFGIGCPKQVKDYIDKQINKILGTDDVSSTIDSLKEIETFLKDFTNSDTLKNLLDLKANVDEVRITTNDIYKKSNPNDSEGNVVDTNTIVSIENNPEYIKVITDNVGKLIESIGLNGIRKFFAGIEVQGTLQCVTDNPEYIAVWIDNQNRIVFGFKTNGDTYFGYGVPSQINSLIETLKSNTETRIDAKANVIDVKATTDDIYKKSNPNDKNGNVVDTNTIFSVEDNPEYIKALTDSVGKLIETIGLDGIRKFFAGINIQGTLQCITDNPEYIAVWLDSQKKIIFGFKTDGDVYIGYGVPSQIKEYISILNTNIQTELDNITQNLANTKEDIDKKINLGDSTYPSNVHEVFDNPEFISAIVDSIGHTLEVYGVEGIKKFFNPIQVMGTLFKTENNPEYVGAELDNNGKILSYRDSYGRKIENVGLGGTKEVLKSFSKSIRECGFTPSFTDWSDSKFIQIAEPRCAFINIYSDDGVATWATTKKDNKKYWMQFCDMQGNYFCKRIIMNSQGQSSQLFIKKNASIDLYNDDWEGKDTFQIKFGNFISCDSFHLKAFYTDFFRGVDIIATKFFEYMENASRDELQNRTWKSFLLNEYTDIAPNGINDKLSKLKLQANDDAKCITDGFPCLVYLNDEFYGVFSMRLKKDRNNYKLDKKNTKHIQLDGVVDENFFAGNIHWEDFEIRNPKSLYCQDGSKYDGDNPLEIMGTDSSSYNESNKGYKNTAKVKRFITDFSNRLVEIKTAISENKSADEIRNLIKTYFDVSWIIDYLIYTNVIADSDAYIKNGLWTTYDGVKWTLNIYDLNASFGYGTWGNTIYSGGTYIRGISGELPFKYIYQYFNEELKNRYTSLRKSNILTTSKIYSYFKDWISRIGEKGYELEYEKWNESPCNRDNNLNSEYWSFTGIINQNPITYKESEDYSVNAEVVYGFGGLNGVYKCIKANGKDNVQPPIDSRYKHSHPTFLGVHDNIYRVYNWLEDSFNYFDKQWLIN